MSKLLKNFVGIDISKLFFDVALLIADQCGPILHQQFEQSKKGFSEMKEWLEKQGVFLDAATLFCMEYTGIYNIPLTKFLCDEKALVWIEMAIRIKKSEGFERSSNDKTDAIKIARYACRFKEKMQLWSPTDDSLNKIKHFIAQRDRIVDTITRLTVPINELKEIGCASEAKEMEKLQKTAITNLEKVKKNIELAISTIVHQDQDLAHKLARVKSIIGIGEVTATAFLVYTKGFTSFDKGNQLSCYCGVVPFIKKKSGISVTSKAKVSQFANKKLKSLLHMCALSAIQHDPELKAYYERKVLEGKNKMIVMNAVRNKLVLRIFAVIRDDRDFVENYKRKCA